ncbi:cytochrome P450 9e2 [Orussus abietinus]|uniref:cytochrome P450 9e2 n=1 Tax=Orussus abietinus TaxID=222816 RepID=UPI000626721F|nr:cytochrome P450 9e2 [Orussus abietinus]
MDFLTAFLAVLLGLLGVYYFAFRSLNHFKKLGIPYVPTLPLVGNMGPFLFRLKPIASVIQDAYDLFPDAKYVGFYDVGNPVIIIRDPELIKTIAVKNFDDFPNHRAFLDPELDPLFANNLFSLRDDTWRQMRTLLSPAFTSSKMKLMFKLMSKCAGNFADHVAAGRVGDKNVVETKLAFTRYTNDVIATCAFGIEVDSMKNPKNEFYVLGRRATNFDGILSLKMFMSRSFPGISKVFGIKVVEDRVARFFNDIVAATVATREEKGLTRPDMIQLMMEARGKDGMPTLDIEAMTSQAFVFFFGGFDTSSSHMCFAAHEIAVNPDVHDRLQAEVDSVLQETGGNPTYEAINAMEYLGAVLNEALRMYPIGPFADRLSARSFELPPALPGLKPITIEPGTNVWFPIFPIHRDPLYYPNPDKFDPERFLGEDKINTSNSATFLTFGLGPRICIGNRFAILETKVVLFHLLARCNLKPCSKTTYPMVFSKKSFAMLPKNGFWLKFEPREKTYLSPASD